MRTTASNNNGGGYTSGGTDYSQQDAAQLNNTDFATSGIGVAILTSVTGGFTAVMVGNIIHLTAGTNLTEGWYEITGYTDTNTVTLDRVPDDGVGGVSAATGYVGGALALPIDAFFEQLTAGNIVWIKAGTYTLTENIDVAKDGLSYRPLSIEGYNSSRDDDPVGMDRPLIAAGAYDFAFDTYWKFDNLRVTSTDLNGFRADDNSSFSNCYSYNSSGSSSRRAFYGYSVSAQDKAVSFINCEGISTLGYGIYLYYGGSIVGCYCHDSSYGIHASNYGHFIAMNIVDTCARGITAHSRDFVFNNTVYNCSIAGINLSSQYTVMVYNNIVSSCTTGIYNNMNYRSCRLDYNNYYNNTTDVENVTKGPHALALDPQFVDAPNADFRIGTNLKAKGFPGQFPGAHTSCDGYLDIGAVQREEAGNGGAATHSYGFVE